MLLFIPFWYPGPGFRLLQQCHLLLFALTCCTRLPEKLPNSYGDFTYAWAVIKLGKHFY